MYEQLSVTGQMTSISLPSEDEGVAYDPYGFDPEETFVDEEVDIDSVALRDAMRDIVACEGRFELLL